MAVELAPITDADMPAVAQFLHENLNTRVPVAAWTRAMRMRWADDAPNHGYFLAAVSNASGSPSMVSTTAVSTSERGFSIKLGRESLQFQSSLRETRLLAALPRRGYIPHHDPRS